MFILYFLIAQSSCTHLRAISQECYGVMFDAGSSGTRVYVYNWPCRQTQTMTEINIQELAPQKKVNPGLATFANKLDEIPLYLQQFITFAKAQIPKQKHSYTPIMLGATAGMRLIPEKDQMLILEQVHDTFRKSGFLFQKEWSRVITGQEEGAYMWLSVNFLLGNLLSEIPPETALTIDLGGASTQIAFIPEQGFNEDIMDIVIPNLNTYDIYSISYLGYGNDQAREAIIRKSIVQGQTIINSPCFHLNYQAVWSDDPTYTINGLGNQQECANLINQYLQPLAQHTQPSVTNNIYAVSGVATMASFFDLSEFTLNQYLQQVTAFTSLTAAQVEANYPGNPYVWTNYFMSIYVHQLLLIGYKIPQTNLIKSPILISNNSPSWTLAATFYQLAQLDCRFDSPVCVGLQFKYIQ